MMPSRMRRRPLAWHPPCPRSWSGSVRRVRLKPVVMTPGEPTTRPAVRSTRRRLCCSTRSASGWHRTGNTNTETDGRFHSKWLTMMYPRLYLARNLLRDDGAIFVSIDDAETHNLRVLLNDIFGESNFVANLLWQKRYVSNATAKHV